MSILFVHFSKLRQSLSRPYLQFANIFPKKNVAKKIYFVKLFKPIFVFSKTSISTSTIDFVPHGHFPTPFHQILKHLPIVLEKEIDHVQAAVGGVMLWRVNTGTIKNPTLI